MKNLGYDNPLYILPFDHRSSFELKMFGWGEDLTPEQTAEIAAAKQVIYDGFKAAIEAGAPKEKAGILVDEQFGAAILRDAAARHFTVYLKPSSGTPRFDMIKRGDVRICVWQDDVLGAVMLGEMSAAEMLRIASLAYSGLNA